MAPKETAFHSRIILTCCYHVICVELPQVSEIPIQEHVSESVLSMKVSRDDNTDRMSVRLSIVAGAESYWLRYIFKIILN